MTLIVNGTTTGLLIEKLGFSKEKPTAKKIFVRVLKDHKRKATELFQTWKQDHYDATHRINTKVDFNQQKDQIQKWAEEIIACCEIPKTNKLYPEQVEADQEEQEGDEQVAVKEIRLRYLMELKCSYQMQYEQGLISTQAFLRLKESISSALDNVDTCLGDFENLKKLYEYNLTLKLQYWLYNVGCARSLNQSLMYNEFRVLYDVMTNYIECTKHVIEQLSHAELAEKDEVLREARKNLSAAERMFDLRLLASFPSVIPKIEK